MASFGTSGSRSLAGRGPAYGFRFFIYAVASVVLMFYDQRGGWLESVRSGLSAAAYPIQLAVNSPSAAARWTRDTFADRDRLQAENATLREQLRTAQIRALRYTALEDENARLRGLTAGLPPLIDKTLVGEVVDVELSALRQRFLINRGSGNSVAKAQAVLTGDGVLGQTLRVSQWSAEVILITDGEHLLPVQIERTGLRTIAAGVGKDDELRLPYVPINADVREGDLLVTSGLGGVFPHGLPVARIKTVTRDPAQPLATIIATPTAKVAQDRQVLLVWFTPTHPAAPATNPAVGTAALQPTVAPQTTNTAPAASTTTAPARAGTPATTPAAATPAPAPSSTPAAAPNTAAPSSTAPPAAPVTAPANPPAGAPR
jgi:rod shape-determining protein MreC